MLARWASERYYPRPRVSPPPSSRPWLPPPPRRPKPLPRPSSWGGCWRPEWARPCETWTDWSRIPIRAPKRCTDSTATFADSGSAWGCGRGRAPEGARPPCEPTTVGSNASPVSSGASADRDVALALLADAPKDLPSRERRALRRLQAHLTDDARIGRELIRASLRAERDLGLFEGIRAGFHTLPSARRAQALGRYLEEVHQEGQEAVRAAHRKARRKPTSRRLHRLRIRVRSWRHLSDLASAIDPSYGRPQARPLRSLQDRLGRLHDLDVVEDLTAASAPPTWNRAIRKERRRQQLKLARSLRSSHWREMVPPGLASA